MKRTKKYINWPGKKQKKLTNGKPSTEMKKETSASSQQASQQVTPSSGTYHSSIKTLLYDSFISVITDESLQYLVISGTPPVDELVTAWETISEEYSSSIKTPRSTSVFDCYKKIQKTKAQIKFIDEALYLLQELANYVNVHHEWNEKFYYDVDTARMISERGYRMIEPADNYEEYCKQIKFVRTQATTLVVILNRQETEYKLLAPDDNKVKRTYQSYIDELAVLSKFQGGEYLRAKNITVMEYIAIVNGFMAYQETMRQQYEKQEAQRRK